LMCSFKRRQRIGMSHLKIDIRQKGFQQEHVSRGIWDLLIDKRRYTQAGMALVLCVRTLKRVMDFISEVILVA
jgi:hypothetical protein